MTDHRIGILGGMGPMATAEFMKLLIEKLDCGKDQDYPRIIVDCNGKIPDRTLAILGHGESPVKAMAETGMNLYRAGATVGAIPCMTAHCFFKSVQERIPLKLLHAPSLLAVQLEKKGLAGKKIGVMATEGSLKYGLYDRWLSRFEVIYPDHDEQMAVMAAIYGPNGVKSGRVTKSASETVRIISEGLIERGCAAIVLGCTELPLLIQEKTSMDSLVINPMEILAEALADCCVGKRDPEGIDGGRRGSHGLQTLYDDGYHRYSSKYFCASEITGDPN